MSVRGRSWLLASAAWIAFAGFAPAHAQDTPAAADPAATTEDDSTDEEVTVTARRREEALKDVPISVSTLSGKRLEETGSTDITALQTKTPNATVQIARGSSSTLISFIRGVGQQDPLWGFEPGVGLYVDDVYIARPQGAVLDIYDVQRIEVLRGPQGTLYGRNTIGGAIKYVTAKLGSEPELNLKTAYGSYNQIDVIASGSAPITDTFRVGGAFAMYNRDGFGENLTTGAEHYNKDVIAGRVSAEFTPTDDLFFRLAADYVRDKSNPKHGYREVQALDFLGNPIPGGAPLASVYDTRAGVGDDNNVVTRGVSFTGEWRASDFVTFKSITAYRDGHTETVIDFDGLPAAILDIPGIYSDHTFTQELQAQFNGDRWQGVAGIFYLNGTADGAFDTILSQAGIVIGTSGSVETESWAIFGDFSYDITDDLHLSLGGRWTRDVKQGTVFRANYAGATRSPLLGGTPRAPTLVRSNYTNERTFEQFTPRVSLSYDFNDSVTGYLSYSQGFKSGGFDMRGDAILTPATVNGYAPELVDTYEAGLKGVLEGGKINFSTAFFYSEYDDRQVTTQVPVGASIASFVDNVASSTMWGWEFEGSIAISENFSANLGLGYIDAKFDEFTRFYPAGAINPITGTVVPPGGVTLNIADLIVFQMTPSFTMNLGFTWTQDLFGGELAITPMASYRSKMSMFEFPSATLDQPGYWLYDAVVQWTAPEGNWKVGLLAKNLTDEEYRIGGYDFPQSAGVLFGNSVSGFYGPPRTFTLTVGVEF